MSQIEIERPHTLGMTRARELATTWADQARTGYAMTCQYETGTQEDIIRFSRTGVSGELHVRADGFTLRAQLGFLLTAFKPRIEAEIGRNLDRLLGGAADGSSSA